MWKNHRLTASFHTPRREMVFPTQPHCGLAEHEITALAKHFAIEGWIDRGDARQVARLRKFVTQKWYDDKEFYIDGECRLVYEQCYIHKDSVARLARRKEHVG